MQSYIAAGVRRAKIGRYELCGRNIVLQLRHGQTCDITEMFTTDNILVHFRPRHGVVVSK